MSGFESKVENALESKGCVILSTTLRVTHDGADEYGWESNLYDYVIKYSDADGVTWIATYHREDWFVGEKEEYVLYDLVKC